jgi:hypothetical protein
MLPRRTLARRTLKKKSSHSLAISTGMQDVGYVEGQNVKMHHRFPAEQPERFYALADELVRLNVDILFTGHDWRPSRAACD